MTYVSHGSSKELFFDEKPTAERATEGVFKATNEFSIFDKGGTSEKSGTGFQFVIPLKFISMDEIIRATYEAMKETGVPTCYIGPEAGGYGSRIKVLRVPGKDGFPKDPLAIPVGESVRVVDAEAIFNFYVHPKSSLLRNFKSGKIKYDDKKYGFKEMPKGGEAIPNAKAGNVPFKYTTKFEDSDRDLNIEEAKERSRLTDDQWEKSIKVLNQGTKATTKLMDKKNIFVCDGKWEIGVLEPGNPNDIVLCDVAEYETQRWLVEPKIDDVLNFADYYVDQVFAYENPAKKARFKKAMGEIEKNANMGVKLFQDVDKQYIRDWFIDNGWNALNESGKSIIPPLMPNRPLNVYSECVLALAERISENDMNSVVKARIGKTLNQPIRPLEPIATEMLVLTELNKAGYYPIDVIA